jgi:GH35 family endo-1,4-beta-xylanase
MYKELLKQIRLTALFLGISLSVFSANTPKGLKDVFQGKFYLGTAMNNGQINGKDTASVRIIRQHFNSITAENIMKSALIQPTEGKFNFELADQFVEFGLQNNMFIVGHCLVWHSQAPKWFFVDESGKDVSREVLISRMKNHIQTVVGRYKGKVNGYDVVNEAILDNGDWRESKFYKIIGPEFVKLAFQFAREADPGAELYYNDYSMALPGRREGVVKMVKDLQKDGIRVDGIGMQGHLSMDFPKTEEFEKSILAFAGLGAQVHITEMDISALPSPKNQQGADVDSRVDYKKELNPYTEGLTAEAEKAHAKRYQEFFDLFLKHQDKIARVTMWGVNDRQSWKNNFPVPGRTDYPLLFDRNNQPKSFVKSLLSQLKTSALKSGSNYLVKDLYIADPSAHVFNGKLYVYPSHDIEAGIPENDNGDHFDMRDFHVFSIDKIGGPVTDHGVALDKKDIPWAGRQLWAPDVAFKNGMYYLYFPLKDQTDIFRIGVATSKKPEGPFKAEANPIKGSYSIDPAVFQDKNGAHYMYFGGIWGGQLQRYRNNKAIECGVQPKADEPALTAKIAKLTDNMLEFAEEPKEVLILDKDGQPLKEGDRNRRFFEAAWVHNYNGKYYFSYSTGDTHNICYATGDNPYGPFTYQGVILTPVVGWTSHHSIVEFQGKWYLFHHDSKLSGGKTHLRSVKVTELKYNADGTIQTIDGEGK